MLHVRQVARGMLHGVMARKFVAAAMRELLRKVEPDNYTPCNASCNKNVT